MYTIKTIRSSQIIRTLSTPSTTITFSGYSMVTTNSISFQFSYVDPPTVSYVKVARKKNDVILSTDTLMPGMMSYTDTAAPFNVDNKYNYVITPYNDLNQVMDSAITTPLTSPSASVQFVNYSQLDTSSVKITMSSAVTYNYIQITETVMTISGEIVTSLPIRLAVNVSSYTAYNLTPDNLYQYVLTPFNAVDVSGASVTTPFVSPLV